jgi:lysyl oxidase-like protein 2/3/4
VLSAINFDSPLPLLKKQAVDKGMPHKGGKIIFQLDGNHDCDIAGTPCGQSPFMFSMSDNYDSAGSNTTALAFTWPDAFSAPHGFEDRETILPTLNNLIEHKASINAYIVHDWATDPYARGAWMTFRPGDMSTYAEALQQSHGKVVMASADWANGFAGFVDGAIEQGAKAASRVKMELAKPYRGAPLKNTSDGGNETS